MTEPLSGRRRANRQQQAQGRRSALAIVALIAGTAVFAFLALWIHFQTPPEVADAIGRTTLGFYVLVLAVYLVIQFVRGKTKQRRSEDRSG